MLFRDIFLWSVRCGGRLRVTAAGFAVGPKARIYMIPALFCLICCFRVGGITLRFRALGIHHALLPAGHGGNGGISLAF